LVTALYSLSDVARLSGASKRSIQYWALTRVLETLPETDRAGTGKHRNFSREEVVIACVINALSQKGLQVGRLTFIAKGFRHAYLQVKHLRETVEGAILNDDRVFLTVTQAGHVHLLSDKHSKTRDLFEIFSETSEDMPNIDILLLNGCFANLRPEWRKG
jgi:hypothetical protein